MLDLVEKALDAIALFVERLAKRVWVLAVAFVRDIGRSALAFEAFSDPVGIIGFVAKQNRALGEIRQQLHEIKSIESFLFTMTRNKIMDHLRKVASDARLRQAIWESMQTIVDNHPAPVEYKEYKEILRKAVDNLPEQRKAIYLMRDEGYNYQEIADEFDISRHTVKNQISAAMKSIRGVFSKFLTF